MKNESMNHALHELFVDEPKEILRAEEHLYKSLPEMAKGATSQELKTAFEDHRKETAGPGDRLKQVFESIGEKALTVKCETMAGRLKEAGELAEDSEKGASVPDAALIAGARKIGHYEIATYGTLAAYAKIAGPKKAKQLPVQPMDEKKAADEKLTGIAGSFGNELALKKNN